MIIEIRKVPDTHMPYDSVADWRWCGDLLSITHVDIGSPVAEWLLARHELDEAMLCKFQGIPVADVDEFDKNFEQLRKVGDNSEPGDRLEAPYHLAHTGAELTERALAATMHVVWGDYVKAIDTAFERVRKARRA